MRYIEDVLTKEDLLALVQTAGELAIRIDLNELLQLILTKSGQLTNSPDGAVLLYNKERDTLYFAGAIGKNTSTLLEQFGEVSQQQVPVVGSKAGAVFQSKESIIVDYLIDDPDHFKGVDQEVSKQTESMLCVPLIVRDTCLGVMQLLNKLSGNYNQRDKILLEEFASYAAIALRNARLFEELIAHMGLYTSSEFSGGITELLNQLNSPARTEKLTVLFADMRGFRVLCQVINSPEKILEMTTQFITMLSNQVLRNGGVVNKFLGDGILALFRSGNHAERAVQCAFAMIDDFNNLKSAWNQENIEQLEFLDIGVGITTDTMIIGTIGSGKVHDFTVLGTAVNLAAAFEKEARSGKRILVDQLTYVAVKDMVAEIDGPFNYVLKHPDQGVGHTYKQYHLKKLLSTKLSTVFISHSQKDHQFVEEELIPMLKKNNIDAWSCEKDIKGGESWLRRLSEGMDSCNLVFVIVSKSSINSDWVKEEVDMAGSRPQLRNKIIPICLDDTKLEDVHPFLLHKQSINAHNNDKYFLELLAKLK